MLKRAIRRGLARLLRNDRVRRLVEDELRQAGHPLLGSRQLAFAPPGHFYSPLPDPALADDPRLYARPADDGVDLRPDDQLRLLDELAASVVGFDWPEQQTPGRRYWLQNRYYEHGDAAVLFAMLRRFRPRRLVEVGSGFSSALMLDTRDRYPDAPLRLTFIEPYPEARLLKLLRPEDATARVIRSPVQEVPLDVFDELEAGDVLFIDSSHVSKIGSDVNHLLFAVLPRLRDGVLVHVHDMFYPFEYPPDWVRGGRAWNETYLLRAFLQYNSRFQVMLFNHYLDTCHPDRARTAIPLLARNPGGAIWLRKIAPPG